MSSMPTFFQQIESELTTNILPFWMNYTVDHENGGFYGALSNDRQINNEVERSAVLCARILWTFSAAYRQFPRPEYLDMARHAYDYLINTFWDVQKGGVYWAVNKTGKPLNDRKQTYAQAFVIYGLAEYHAASGSPESLKFAKMLFGLLEKHTADSQFGGYIAARDRNWGDLADMRLSDSEPNCPKSMNTLLHVMEAYTRLYTLWPDPALRQSLRSLLEVMQNHVIDHERGAFHLFFERDWQVLSDQISYGHDIEGSWLLVEAAEALGDEPLRTHLSLSAVSMATSVYRHGRDSDGAVLYEANSDGLIDADKHWWVQAESLVGFYSAYKLSGDIHFLCATRQIWQVINEKFIDRQHGEWYKIIDQAGNVRFDHFKTGPWECPYHNARACMEMLKRLK
ncbi:MAG: AGE family epimerase/isomerase [Anaerolineae bacterium]|nr:AGE family epimerase/isomerase [Anaerolineae bacterium]